jgi:sugar O-acyltransferase (sialic acid O-acetyltransferase NeuD family)
MPEGGERFLVWGAGGHGKVVADLIRCSGHGIIGFVDADSSKCGTSFAESVVLLSESDLFESLNRGRRLPADATALAFGMGDNTVRQAAYERLGSVRLPTLVHPAAAVAASASIGAGSVVLAGAVVNPDARIGKAVIINSGVIVEHDCVVGDAGHLSPGAVLTGGVQVGRRAWIGAGSIILPEVNIGENTVVGAGAVVTSDLPANCTAAGIPAKVIKKREEGWLLS